MKQKFLEGESPKFYKVFFIKALKKAGTSFVLLFQSKNTIGRLTKTCLYKPVEISYFFPAGDFKNV